MERTLAVVLAADVVGYGCHMGEDEADTLDALKAHREYLVEPSFAEHEESVIKVMGDGVWAEFPDVVGVVERAEGILRKTAERAPQGERLHAVKSVLERGGK